MLNQILFWGGMSLFVTTAWALRKLQAEVDERWTKHSEEEEKEETPVRNCACC